MTSKALKLPQKTSINLKKPTNGNGKSLKSESKNSSRGGSMHQVGEIEYEYLDAILHNKDL